ncbi:MAG: mechanosensitive ion channel [Steroidobacteraceae bacterium]|nr:mechanosensitive ion channel [Steroidobacteraceae bacterium]
MDELTKTLERAWTWSESLVFTVGTFRIDIRQLVLLALLVVVIILLGKFTERAVQRLGKRFADGDTAYPAAYAFGRIMKYVVLILGAMIGLDMMGLDVSKLALIGGAIGVGVGFGLQNIVSNFVSGIILLTERSLKVGDFVDLQSGVRGRVVEIAMRYTRVSTNDLVDILVPNSEFVNGRVTNWTFDEFSRRIRVPFGVAYGTDKERVKAAGVAAAKRISGIIVDDPRRAPDVWLVGFGDSALNFELVVWVSRRLVTSPGRTEAAILWAIDDELRAANIEIPFPQRDLHVRSGELRVRLDEKPAAKTSDITPSS